MLKPTKILVPTDFSSYSDVALRQALDIAAEYNSIVYVLHVVEQRIHYAINEDYEGNVSVATINKLENNLVRSAKSKLEVQLDKIVRKKNVKVVSEVILGKPYVEILRFQQEKKIDLVVISSLGHTGLSKYFIGGVARIVLKGTTCPVLLTKGNIKK